MDKSHDKVLRNVPPSPLLTHHFAFSEKMVLTLAGGGVVGHKTLKHSGKLITYPSPNPIFVRS